MKTLAWALLILLSFASFAAAQTDEDLVRQAIEKYIEGSSHNRSGVFLEAFYDDARMFLNHPERELWIMTPQEYASRFETRDPGKFNGRTGKVLEVDVENDIATAKAEIFIPNNNRRYVDIFLLKRLGGQWKVLSKAATSEEMP